MARDGNMVNKFFESSTPSSSDKPDDIHSDIQLSDDSYSDDFDSCIASDDPVMSETSQEIRDALNFSSSTNWVGVTPTTTEYYFTGEEKINICEQNSNTP